MKWKIIAFLDIYPKENSEYVYSRTFIEDRMDVLRSFMVLTYLPVGPTHCERDEIMHKCKQIPLNHL
jgi:hypothetical protein